MTLIDNIPYTRVGPSEIHGDGLFAETAFLQGQIVGTLDGQVVRHAEHPEAFDLEWNAISDDLLLVRAVPTKYRFINHARSANCFIDERDQSIRAARDMVVGDELTLDYSARPLPPAYRALERTAFLSGDESDESEVGPGGPPEGGT